MFCSTLWLALNIQQLSFLCSEKGSFIYTKYPSYIQNYFYQQLSPGHGQIFFPCKFLEFWLERLLWTDGAIFQDDGQ